MRNLILAGILFTTLSPLAHAGIFSDDEARKKVTDLQQLVQIQNQATQALLSELKANQQALEQRISAIEAVVKGQGLVDLLGQVERLNQDLSRVKGQLEVTTHELEVAQQRQRDLYADTDSRLRKLEGGAAPASAEVPAAAATPEVSADIKDFDAAQALSKAGKTKESFDAYDKFLQTYPNSALVPDAQYALGYAQFSLKNYKAAIATQQKLIKQFPDSKKLPDAMMNIANSQIQLADIDGAKTTLRGLLEKYPTSEVAPNAKKRLAVLESIKK